MDTYEQTPTQDLQRMLDESHVRVNEVRSKYKSYGRPIGAAAGLVLGGLAGYFLGDRDAALAGAGIGTLAGALLGGPFAEILSTLDKEEVRLDEITLEMSRRYANISK